MKHYDNLRDLLDGFHEFCEANDVPLNFDYVQDQLLDFLQSAHRIGVCDGENLVSNNYGEGYGPAGKNLTDFLLGDGNESGIQSTRK